MEKNSIKAQLIEMAPIIVMAIALIIFKIPHLSLPHYWDEAWPFAAAIQHLYDHGVSILPDAIPPNVSRGHPLLFHFLTASWMKVFGSSLVAKHTFPLLLSVILLFATYFLAKSIVNKNAAYMVVLIFGLQQMFLVQSSMLLLEVMLTLWGVLTVYGYMNQQKWLYFITGSALLLTKESGIVLIMAVAGWHVISQLFSDYKALFSKTFLLKLLLYISPVFIAAVYFTIQRIQLGWFFFPKHIGFMSFEWADILLKLNSIKRILFMDAGRWSISILFVLSLGYLLVKKSKIKDRLYQLDLKWLDSKQAHFFGLSLLFLLGFIAFSSLNFLSTRYLMIMLPFFIIQTFLLFTAIIKNRLALYLVGGILSIIILIPTPKNKSNADVYFGFKDAIEVHQRVRNYCEQNIETDAEIYTHFLINMALSKPYVGYFDEGEKRFKNISWNFSETTDYCIFSNMERDKAFDLIKKENDLKLLKRFEKNKAWTNIYKVVEYKRNSDGK